jgi:hypothetical protein
MKTSNIIIVLLILMNFITLNMAISNRDAIVTTLDALDTLSTAFITEDK